MNVGTGRYIKRAGWWYAQAVTGNSGHPITPTLNNGKYELVTVASEGRSLGTGLFMDNIDHNTWTLTPVSGTSYQYYIEANNGALSTSGTTDLAIVTKNESDDNQKWIFVTESGMLAAMADANSDYPFNFTPMLQAAEFDDFDNWGLGGIAASNWTNFTNAGFSIGGGVWGAGMDQYNFCAVANTKNSITISQSLGTLPTGYYNVSFEAFYRSRTSSADETLSGAAVKFGSNSIAIPNNRNTAIGTGTDQVAAIFRDNDTYRVSQQIQLASATNITLSVTKPNTNSTKSAWVCIDDFYLRYYGASAVADPNAEFKSTVLAYVNAMYPNVLKLNDAGQAAYDITIVTYRYKNEMITSAADAQAMCDIVDAAYANAYSAHLAYNVQNAIDQMEQNGGDITGAIVNPSFETGDLTGWTVHQNGKDTRVADNLNATGMDGTYLFNSWADTSYDCGIVYQEINGLPNGYYTMTAGVASWGDRKVYVVGNNKYKGVNTRAGDGVMVDLSVDFLVENGTALIGAVGGHEGGDFYFPRGIFYKVDNFRLAYKGEVGEGRVKIALADAREKAEGLNPASKAQFESAVARYETATITGDGKAEETAIYDALNTAIATQPYANTNMTWMIENPSFETGDWAGWQKPEAWDAVVLHATHANAPGNGEGFYVVNVWNDQAGIEGSGINKPVYQTISDLPNGRYRLTADVASDGGNQVCVYATVGGESVSGAASPANNWTFVEASVEFEVTNGAATIGAVGYRNGAFNVEGGCWYKADNFRLTYLGNDLTLDETATTYNAGGWYTSVTVNRTIAPEKWSTFVVPFNMSIPDGWTVKKLSGTVPNGDNLTLQFEDASEIVAGVPYMVFVNKAVNTISANNVEVLDYVDSDGTSDVDFIGTYTAGNVPEGHYFISNNTFYKAAHENNTIKGFRATFEPAGSYVKSIGYTFDEDGFTAIEGVEESGVTIEAVYGVDGALRAEMQKGINIVKMSNGTVKKVLVK
jgi:hypothetical protein